MRVATYRLLTILYLLCSILAACAAPSSMGEAASPLPTATVSEALLSPSSTVAAVADSTRTPSSPSTSLNLGEPIALGRGEIIEALFLSGGTLVVGWAAGISVVELPSGEERWWQPAGAAVIAVDVHPQGHAIAAALTSGEVLILDMASGSVQRFDGAAPHVTGGDISWSPDGKRIAFQFSGPGRHDPISVLDVARGTLQTVPDSQLREGSTPSLTWTPDNQAITLGAYGMGCTPLLEIETGKPRFSLEYEGQCYQPLAMTWSPNSRHVALVGEAGVVLVDSESGQIQRRLEGAALGFTLTRGNFSDSGPPLLFSSDGQFIVSKGGISLDDSVLPLVVWEVETGEKVAQLGDPGNANELGIPARNRLAIGFEGETLLSLYEDGTITQISFAAESAEERPIAQIPVIVPQPPFAWSADGSRIAARNRYQGVVVWDAVTGEVITWFEAPLDYPALSPNGTLLALSHPDEQQLHLYDLTRGERVQLLPDATLPVPACDPCFMTTLFSPDGAEIAYSSQNRVIVADIATGRQIAALEGGGEEQRLVQTVWAPDGGALAATTATPLDSPAESSLILWERTADGTFKKSLERSTQAGTPDSTQIRFSPTGKIVALQYTPVAHGPSHVAVYDREAGEVVLTLEDHQILSFLTEDRILTRTTEEGWNKLVQVNISTGDRQNSPWEAVGNEVFMPGGHYYVSVKGLPDPASGSYSTFAIYDGQQVIAEGDHGSEVRNFSWSQDGRSFLSLAYDGTVKRWAVLPDGD